MSIMANCDIRSRIEAEMAVRGMTFSQLAHESGVNRGVFSAIFNRNPPKPMSIHQLDLIAAALRQPEGWLYDLYVDECFQGGRNHWKRTKMVLLRCVELERADLIDRILVLLMEDPTHTHEVFDFAEKLYAEGQRKPSIPFYRCVAENEIKQHSERLIISQYKWFRARIGDDLEENRAAALQFSPFRKRLPVPDQVEGLLQLAFISFHLHKWDEVMGLADEMRALLAIIRRDQNDRKQKGLPEERLSAERHLAVYIGHSFLLKASALKWLGRYEEALASIQAYEESEDGDGLDEAGLNEVERFRLYAEANRLNLHVLMGRLEHLPRYVDYLDHHPEIWLTGFLSIMVAVNRHRFQIDDILTHYQDHIDAVKPLNSADIHTEGNFPFQMDQSARLSCQLAIYSFRLARYPEGMEWLLHTLRRSLSANNRGLALLCAAYYEQYREKADAEQRAAFRVLLHDITEHPEVFLC
ncbi:helix-turn-helix domain-containing protein [Gorillibacterium timonense]|uniref:helix-turn-helix domain-containing protein n=1 Tax=Gorillibacterium timonense TaxID=1689269 RepID=UPI00071DD966|nr:helix-turn-helix transcriptional regulator [Gorillibacterium timonense]